MATTDIEKLVVQLSADIKQYEREMRKAQGVTNAQARAIENRYRAMSKNLDAIGKRSAQSLIAPLAGIGAALSAREVLRYADAWTSAKNSLAVAGVVGDRQADVLERLYQSAQRNAAPVGSLADLFGKAAQASDVLGASQEELLKFSDGVAVALRVAGTSAGAASGALTQLGQLLGSTRVQAEEFNSVNEGARPILIAVANGLDAAGGSVSKLKKLVTEGKVSGQQFFQAFLKGLPTIQAMAANSTQTIEQGITKVNNAFTKYIGETDESLSASQRLVAGLNALADNFDNVADVTLKVAAIIAGALVGRSITMMIAKLGLAATAVTRLVAAIRSAGVMAGLATSMGGIAAAAGPIGLVVGGAAVAALALFSASSGEASASGRRYAEVLAEIRKAAEEAAPAVEDVGNAIDEKRKNQLVADIETARVALEGVKGEAFNLIDAFTEQQSMSLLTDDQRDELLRLRKGLDDGTISAKEAEQSLYKMATADYNFQEVADSLSPILVRLAEAIIAAKQLGVEMQKAAGGVPVIEDRASRLSTDPSTDMVRAGKAYTAEAERRAALSRDQLALETEIARIKKDAAEEGAILTDRQIEAIARLNLAGNERRSGEGKAAKAPKRTAEDRLAQDLQAVRDRTAALIAEREALGLSFEEQQRRVVALDLEQQALADLREEARRKGETDLESIKLSPEQIAQIDAVAAAYARQAAELRDATEAQELQRGVLKGTLGDLRSALSDGKLSWQEIGDVALNALDKIIDKIEDDLVDAIQNAGQQTSGGGVFGWLSKIFGLFGIGGGKSYFPPAPGGGAPAYLAKSPAAAPATAQMPSVTAPRVPNIAGMAGGGTSITVAYSPTYSADGASTEAIAKLAEMRNRDREDEPARIIRVIKQAQKQRVI